MKAHQDAVIRLAEVPGLGIDSAHQIIAEVGAQASTLASAAELTSWVGTCPGKEESAERNHSSRSAKGNKYLRRVLNQVAHAAVKRKGCYFQALFRVCYPGWAISPLSGPSPTGFAAWFGRSGMKAVRFIEQGQEPDPWAKKQRAQMLARARRKLGYEVTLTPIKLASA